MKTFQSILMVALTWSTFAAESFTVASYNVENYLGSGQMKRKPKPPEARRAVREAILRLRPDVLALQEIGQRDVLEELRAALKTEGLDYRHLEFLQGPDPVIHLAVLSRFPIVARRSQAHVFYLLDGRRFPVQRGFVEVDIRIGAGYQFTLINVHLKSKRPVPEADQAEMRLEESRKLRARVLELLRKKEANLLVVGDLNDTPNAKPIKTVIGRQPKRLVDLRPAELPGAKGQRRIVWTSFYKTEDAYDRFDYLLASSGMVREWSPAGTRVLAWPGGGKAADHRPIIAEFTARDE